jgi:putative endonuclease
MSLIFEIIKKKILNLRQRRSSSIKTARDIGFEKEREVVEYLKNLNYEILTTNFRTPFGEIDIVARRNKIVVFVEVKYRSSSSVAAPHEAVNSRKQRKIIKSAIMYIKQNNIKESVRFDIVSVRDGEIEIINSAFTPPENLYYF